MRLPSREDRLGLYGMTGSGKTRAMLYHLSRKPLHEERWAVLDFKRDEGIGQIPRTVELGHGEEVPNEAGVYVYRPLPHEQPQVEAFMWGLWRQGNCGLVVDEGYQVSRFSRAFDALTTQGRSLRVPLIVCSQRPSWLSRFTMASADFHQVFHTQHPRDLETLGEWVPGMGPSRRDFHSWYYDVAADRLDHVVPVPDLETILDRLDEAIPRRVRLFRGWARNATSARP